MLLVLADGIEAKEAIRIVRKARTGSVQTFKQEGGCN
jgi:hypothetical protein